MEILVNGQDLSFVANDFVEGDFKDKRLSKSTVEISKAFIKRPGAIITLEQTIVSEGRII